MDGMGPFNPLLQITEMGDKDMLISYTETTCISISPHVFQICPFPAAILVYQCP